MFCKTYDESLQKQAVNMDLQCILYIANSSYTVKTPKDESNLQHILEFLEKNENLQMFPSKQEISKSNRRTGDNLSEQESPVQNRRVGMYVGERLVIEADGGGGNTIQGLISSDLHFL